MENISIDPRYHRLARFHRIQNAGVKKLNDATVVILGCGALGAQHAETLVRSGIGHLILIDRDFVELTNLQRQTLFTEKDAELSLPKVIALKNHLAEINASIHVTAHIADVSGDNIVNLIKGADLLLDGTDNLALRMLINDACYQLNTPWIFGSALESYGMSHNFNFSHLPELPCLRCILGAIPLESGDTCSSVGVIQPILQLISSVQTTEAMKFFVDAESSRDTLFTMDLWSSRPQNVNLAKLKNPNCPTCGNHPTYPSLQEKKREAQRLCGDGSVMIREVVPLDLVSIQQSLVKENIRHQFNEYFLNIHLENHRVILFKDGRGIVYNTNDIDEALDVYQKMLRNVK